MRWLLALLLAASCGDDAAERADAAPGTPDARPDPPSGDIREQLEAIPGLTIEDEMTFPSGTRFFELTFEQPADHDAPDGVRFQQHMTLLHRGADQPLIFALNGYYLDPEPYEEELTELLHCNQLAVEHRFFEPSRPEPADWSLLTIEQSAADHHRIAEAFHPLYPQPWISTGASKGGMTAVFHRRFYPDDVTATVPYVAPILHGAPDARFLAFFDTVGDDSCRQALHAVQREILLRRDAMRSRVEERLIADGYTFDIMGLDVAIESSAMELEWLFWQYGDAAWCDEIPTAAATDEDIYDFFDAIATPAWSSDVVILYYQPFYVQTDAELGWPDAPHAHLDDLLQYQDVMPDYLPEGVTPVYDPAPMMDIADWLGTEGSTMLFIYGQNDPWTAGKVDLGSAADSFLYIAPGQNHGASISSLAPDDQTAALATIERWTGVTPSSARAARTLGRRESLRLR